MAKEDHPAFQGRPDQVVPDSLPHIRPSVFNDGVYFLHQVLDGEHIMKRFVRREDAEKALAVLNERMGKH